MQFGGWGGEVSLKAPIKGKVSILQSKGLKILTFPRTARDVHLRERTALALLHYRRMYLGTKSPYPLTVLASLLSLEVTS